MPTTKVMLQKMKLSTGTRCSKKGARISSTIWFTVIGDERTAHAHLLRHPDDRRDEHGHLDAVKNDLPMSRKRAQIIPTSNPIQYRFQNTPESGRE